VGASVRTKGFYGDGMGWQRVKATQNPVSKTTATLV
jgi:hypothetical protein